MAVHVQCPRGADHGDGAAIYGVASFDLQWVPWIGPLIFGTAKRIFTGLAMRRVINHARYCTTDILHNEP